MGRLTGAAIAGVALVASLALLASAYGNVVGGANVKVTFRGSLRPRALPRHGVAPVALEVKGTVGSIDGNEPPALDRVEVEINRFGRFTTKGLPVCPRGALEAKTTKGALAACHSALIGTGSFRAHVVIPESTPFPAKGRMLAFNSRARGHRIIAVHIFGTDPLPTSNVVTMTLRRAKGRSYGTLIDLEMPNVGSDWGRVTGFGLKLHRLYRVHGHSRSVVSASCPAPGGIGSAVFPAARGTFFLDDGRSITRVVSGRCRVADGR